MSDGQHAFLAPSAAHRWRRCPGSAKMEAMYPDMSDKQAAAEGTAVHWVMERLFNGDAKDTLDVLVEPLSAPNGVSITREMREAAMMLVKDVTNTLGPLWPNIAEVERPVRIPRVHPEHNRGTPDVKAWLTPTCLHIWDLKYGHDIVEVFENDQLIDYAAGCLSEQNERRAAGGLPAISESDIEIVMRIVQPRAFHPDGPIREWRVKATALRDHIFALSMAADEATSENPECKPHPDACRHCCARHACDALQRTAYAGIGIARRAVPVDMSPAALGLEARILHDAAKLIEARRSGLAQQIESIIKSGQPVPHWGMKPGQSREKWQEGKDAEVIALGQMYGVNVAKPPEAITPRQAKDAGLPAEIVSAYSFRPPAGMVLSVDDGSDARRVFSA